MIKELDGDVLNSEANLIIHQANCQHAMFSGIAAQIRKQFPEAVEADLKTIKGDEKKLGTFSFAKTKNGKMIVNMYSQFDVASPEKPRATNYEAMALALEKVKAALEKSPNKYIIGIPALIGSDRGGGDWRVVKAIIKSVFEKSDLDVRIYSFEP